MTDENLRQAYQQLLSTRSSAALGEHALQRQPCVTPEALLAVVERRGSTEQREVVLRHVAECADCRADLNLLRAVKATRPGFARRMLPLVAAASVLLATSLTIASRARHDADVNRSGGGVTLIGPRGDIAKAPSLHLAWTAVPDAELYAVQILNSDGVTVFSRSTSATNVEIPADSVVSVSREYVWVVTAQLNDGRELRSEPVRFRVVVR